MLGLRRQIRQISNQIIFEPNRSTTLQRFSDLVKPILADAQAKGGVQRYLVRIDTSTTTQNDIDNNTIRGKIYVQPVKSLEFVGLDFVVSNAAKGV